MKNYIYVRSNKSIFSISLTRIVMLIPLIIFGFYKYGLYLYLKGYTDVIGMFKPLILLVGSILIGCLVNIIYEYIIKNSEENLKKVLFSSFHIEYAIFSACITSINVNYLIYFSTLFILLFLSKFTKNRVNIVCLIFIVIYVISKIVGDFSFINAYEANKNLSLSLIDYLLGKSVGGIFTTNIILLFISFIVLYLTKNNKSIISGSSIFTYSILIIIFSFLTKINVLDAILTNNYLFLMTYVATDSVTSSYTVKGMYIFGIMVGILTFLFRFIDPILAPTIAILIVSLFNNIIDRIPNMISSKKSIHLINR